MYYDQVWVQLGSGYSTPQSLVDIFQTSSNQSEKGPIQVQRTFELSRLGLAQAIQIVSLITA